MLQKIQKIGIHRCAGTPNRGFAMNEKQIRLRMKTVVSIEKITKAMKMVATSQMKGKISNLAKGKDYGHESVNTFLSSDPYMTKNIASDSSTPRLLVIPISSDRGLCGATNANIIREVKQLCKEGNTDKLGILTLGEKATSALLRPFPSLLGSALSEITEQNFSNVSAVGKQIIEEAGKGDYDKMLLIFNTYVNAISSKVTHLELMTPKTFLKVLLYSRRYGGSGVGGQGEIPHINIRNTSLYEHYFYTNLYSAVLNNSASEETARMNAMESASQNAGDLAKKLELDMNKARQARITSELCEIVSGAAAL